MRLNAYKVFLLWKNSNHKKCFSHKSAEIWRSIKKSRIIISLLFFSRVWPFWIMKRMDKQRESDNIVRRRAQWRKDTSGFAFIDCSADGKSAKGKQKSYHCVVINAFCGGSQKTDRVQAFEFILANRKYFYILTKNLKVFKNCEKCWTYNKIHIKKIIGIYCLLFFLFFQRKKIKIFLKVPLQLFLFMFWKQRFDFF